MASRMVSNASCIFCKIVKGKPSASPVPSGAGTNKELPRNAGDIPSFKLFESEKTLAFLDINPLSRGHAVRQWPS